MAADRAGRRTHRMGGMQMAGKAMTLLTHHGEGPAFLYALFWSPKLGVFAVRAAVLEPRHGRVIWSVSSL